MKHHTLRIVAYSFGVLAWVILATGIVVSIIIAIKAATPLAQVTFLIGGLIVTALNTIFLLGSSKLIYLFLDIDCHLAQISENLSKSKDLH